MVTDLVERERVERITNNSQMVLCMREHSTPWRRMTAGEKWQNCRGNKQGNCPRRPLPV